MWEKMGSGTTDLVGRYVRVRIAAEVQLDPSLLSEARLLEAQLGIGPKAMRMLLWTIEEAPADAGGSPANVRPIRSRVRAIEEAEPEPEPDQAGQGEAP